MREIPPSSALGTTCLELKIELALLVRRWRERMPVTWLLPGSGNKHARCADKFAPFNTQVQNVFQCPATAVSWHMS